MNELISICIPTYNRGSVLKATLASLIAQVRHHSVPIYISDNCSTDNTDMVVKELARDYEYIFYHKNAENIGLDRNFESVLRMSESRYAWLLGDDDGIRGGSLAQVLECVSSNHYDLIVLNGGFENKPYVRVSRTKSQSFKDINLILSELGWHMTWMSALIFSRESIEKMKFSPHYDTLFSHIGAIFHYLSERGRVDVYWLNQPIFYPTSKAVFSWGAVIFEVFGKNWTEIVMNLPNSYTSESKLNCIRRHGSETGLFSFLGFLNLRSKNAFSRKTFREYGVYLKIISNIPAAILYMIAIFPVNILSVLSKVARYIKYAGK
jgi:abequosyltransferase